MIPIHRQRIILLPQNNTQKQQGTSMRKVIMLFSLITATSMKADQDFKHVYCNAAMQLQKNMIEGFITKSLREGPRLQHSQRAGKRCVETTFTVKDLQRIGATGLSEMRIIDTSSSNPSYPSSEIHGWKILSPNTTNNQRPLSLISYIPANSRPRNRAIEIEAHCIIPKTDAPEEGAKEYIKLGFWIDNTQEGQPIGEDGITFVTSKDVLIPDKGSFNDAKAIHISVTIRVKPPARPKDLLRIILNRVSVSEDKTEFDHKQGIALNALTIRYPI